MPSPIYPSTPLPIRVFTVQLLGVPVVTTGSPVDAASVSIQSSITRWTPLRVLIRAASATGTLAAGTFGVYSAAAAGGTTIVTAAALTALTAANKLVLSTVAAQTDGITDTSIFVRQTVNSVNAGTIDVIVEALQLN